MWELLRHFWLVLLTLLDVALAVAVTVHALLHKRDTRATTAWVALAWLAPLIGSLSYYCFGINRIRRRALRIAAGRRGGEGPAVQTSDRVRGEELVQFNPSFRGLYELVGRLTDRHITPGNRVATLVGGEEAFPEMLRAIDDAQRSISLCSYIFDNDRAGEEFLDALLRAKDRGVEVRVLIDDVGSRYSRPTMVRRLAKCGLTVKAFLPTRVPRMVHFANLRNHRKILVIDGKVGFTGGMNIREGNRLDWNTGHPIQDVHFRLDGPVVAHLQEAFVNDWVFSSDETLEGPLWFPELTRAGDVFARGISDGPDDDFEKMVLTIIGALSAAASSVYVVTPYFLPEAPLITALNVAAMRGVDVNIVLPAENNLKLVEWASQALLWQVLERGCRVWMTPPPFDHTKLVIVDRAWSLVGSSNWDPRSLRLNFELNVECYDQELAGTLADLTQSKIDSAREVSLTEVDSRRTLVRLRDGAARLFSPYL